MYSDGVGVTSSDGCIRCSTGRFSTQLGNDKVTDCTACFPGLYSNEKGQTHCNIVEPGHYGVNSTHQRKCGVGKFGMGGRHHCAMCEIGYYNGRVGQAACKYCPEGWSSNQTGAIACGERVAMGCDRGNAKNGNGTASSATSTTTTAPGGQKTSDNDGIGSNSDDRSSTPTASDTARIKESEDNNVIEDGPDNSTQTISTELVFIVVVVPLLFFIGGMVACMFVYQRKTRRGHVVLAREEEASATTVEMSTNPTTGCKRTGEEIKLQMHVDKSSGRRYSSFNRITI
mgnify:FL=1